MYLLYGENFRQQKMIIALVVGLTAVLLPGLSVQQCFSPDDTKVQNSPNTRQDLFIGEQAFSLAMLREAVADNPTGNVFFSPYSVYNALLLAYFGAANQTELSLKAALRIPESQSKISTMQAYRFEKYFQSMREINGSESYELRSANKLFIAKRLKLRDCIAHLFEDEVEPVDFVANPEAVRQNINNWVEIQTKRHIQDLIPKDRITADTELVLANAAYFKGLWKSQFLPEHTRKDVFYVSHTKQTLVDMMKQKGTFNHIVSENLGAHVLELPYKGSEVSMFIFLPPYAKSNGIEAVIKQLSVEGLQDIVEEDSLRAVEVVIPKFTVEQSLELTPILERLGIGDLFQFTSDLSGFTEDGDLHLDKAVHKAKISVDEQGTVAAAASAVISFRSSRPLTPARFIANHPFIYLLFDKTSQTIQFMGVYRSPNN
ncbi:serine protease inhibitor 88Ea-like isoform X2 [Zootermopsis nevadensis]|uniref:serine protease inhibitor 88Ea-like isoform X2 n=1 Tax=Zootermopsis nevadensis TaxID=136037 RepID=UPI000B8E4076|nr:serine protease inhibitor 88Ea-like isoform X2 [Zootermopsis nevadensis]